MEHLHIFLLTTLSQKLPL